MTLREWWKKGSKFLDDDEISNQGIKILKIFEELNKSINAMNDIVAVSKENAGLLKDSAKYLKESKKIMENNQELSNEIRDSQKRTTKSLYQTKFKLDNTLEKSVAFAEQKLKKSLSSISLPNKI